MTALVITILTAAQIAFVYALTALLALLLSLATQSCDRWSTAGEGSAAPKHLVRHAFTSADAPPTDVPDALSCTETYVPAS